MSPKRAAFSLNIDSNSDIVSEQHPAGTKIIDHTDISYITKPFEKAVNNAIDDVVQGSSGKKIHSVDGDLHYSSEKKKTSETSSTLSIKNKSKKRTIERKYDTSEL
jgi:ribose 5-phosphate isomerase B